jgi:hypothetical protein
MNLLTLAKLQSAQRSLTLLEETLASLETENTSARDGLRALWILRGRLNQLQADLEERPLFPITLT